MGELILRKEILSDEEVMLNTFLGFSGSWRGRGGGRIAPVDMMSSCGVDRDRDLRSSQLYAGEVDISRLDQSV